MNNLILTTKGKLKIKQYIEICKKKKKREWEDEKKESVLMW